MNMLEKMFSLKGKVILVTGGAQGIGKIVSEHMAAVGADIVIVDIQEEKAIATAAEIAKQYNCKTMGIGLDVTKADCVAKAIEAAHAEMGKVDGLFNNAAIVQQKSTLEITPEEWRNVIDINLNGVFIMAQAFAKYLVAHDLKGSIVNTSSMSGIIVNYPQEQASYNVSKAGVTHLTKCLAVEWCGKGIRVNCISPGYMYTELTCHVRQDWQDQWAEMTPYKRIGKPEELAGAVIYLFSDCATFTSGCEMVIDGCFTLI